MRTDYEADGYANRYRRARALSSAAVSQWQCLLSEAIPGESVDVVLDAGAGIGRFWPVLEVAWQPTTLVALDSSMAMLARAYPSSSVRRIVGDLADPPVSEGSIDVVFCSMSLHHTPRPSEAVQRLRESLKPGGWLVIRSGTQEDLNGFDFLRFFPTAEAAERRAMPRGEELRRWVEGAGMEVEAVEVVVSRDTPTPARAWLNVACRGFPSLQMVPPVEFAGGLLRYGGWLIGARLGRARRNRERSTLIVARRR